MIKTKIFATLGPASSSQTELRKMIRAGLDGVRLNFSHGTHEEHQKRIDLVRALNKKMRRSVKILQDLEGYRIRVGRLKGPVSLKKGHTFYLTQEKVLGDERVIPFDYGASLKGIKPGARVFIEDGKIVLGILRTGKRSLKVKALIPGIVKDHKGINIPGARLEFEAFTDKDRRDLEVAVREKLDMVAQSFVRNAGDVRYLRSLLKARHPRCALFAKIESQEALGHLDEIIDEADGIIVARGDLGICVPIYRVPVIQQVIIQKCRLRKKPVFVATQMMESMTENSLPTRAEVSDVAHAIWEGASHLLLSGETAVGRHPHLVVDMMNQTIKQAENFLKCPSTAFDLKRPS